MKTFIGAFLPKPSNEVVEEPLHEPVQGFVVTSEMMGGFVTRSENKKDVVIKPTYPEKTIEEIFDDGGDQHVRIIKVFEQYNIKGISQIPDNLDELVAMKGIGKKLAQVILARVVGLRPNE